MEVLTIASTKGGVGKSSLTTNLAVAAANDGLRVALVDLDPMGSLTAWWEVRGEPDNPILVVGVQEMGLEKFDVAMQKIAAAKIDLVVIDTPPALMPTIRAAIREATFVLIPTQPSMVDLHGITATLELVAAFDKDFAFVVNRSESRDPMSGETLAYLKQEGATVPTVIGNRKAFRSAMAIGKTGAEMEPAKAGKEIAAVWAWLKKRLHVKAKKVA